MRGPCPNVSPLRVNFKFSTSIPAFFIFESSPPPSGDFDPLECRMFVSLKISNNIPRFSYVVLIWRNVALCLKRCPRRSSKGIVAWDLFCLVLRVYTRTPMKGNFKIFPKIDVLFFLRVNVIKYALESLFFLVALAANRLCSNRPDYILLCVLSLTSCSNSAKSSNSVGLRRAKSSTIDW